MPFPPPEWEKHEMKREKEGGGETTLYSFTHGTPALDYRIGMEERGKTHGRGTSNVYS